MPRDWKSVLNGNPTDWLLEHENSSVRYFTLRDILGLPEDYVEVAESKRAIAESKTVSRIFRDQRPGG